MEDGRRQATFLAYYVLLFQDRSKKATETQKKICVEYGEGAVTDWMCQKWFAKFCAGDFLLDNAPRSGRPVEVDSDQMETLIENSQGYTTWVIADILKISKSIKLLVKTKNVSFSIWEKTHKNILASPIDKEVGQLNS